MCWNDETLQHTTSVPPLVHPSIAISLHSKIKTSSIADEVQGMAMYDGVDADAKTGISHKRKMP